MPHGNRRYRALTRRLDRFVARSVGSGNADDAARARVLAVASSAGLALTLLAVAHRAGLQAVPSGPVAWGTAGFGATLVALGLGAPIRPLLTAALLWHTAGLTAEAFNYRAALAGAWAPMMLTPLAWVWGLGTRAGAVALAWALAVVAALGFGLGGPPATEAEWAGLLGMGSASVVAFVIAAAYDLERQGRLRTLEATRLRSLVALDTGRLGLVQWAGPEEAAQLNRRARRILGFGADDVVGWRGLLERIAEHDRAGATALPVLARSQGGRAGMELEWTRPDGELRWLVCDVAVDPEENDPTVVVTLRDCTAERREAAMREEFLGNVSHELRSPLTALAGALSLIGVEPLPPESRRFLALAESNTGRLLRLVDDLLELQRGESGALRLELSHTVPAALLRDLVAGSPPAWPRIEMEFDEVPPIHTDPQRVAQIVTNLLSNAARHSPPEAPVHLRLLPRPEGGVRIEVADHGPGVPAAFREQIFQRYAQVRPGRGSSGLGLAISRALATRLGGRLGFESVEGAGATFWVELPAVAVVGNRRDSVG